MKLFDNIKPRSAFDFPPISLPKFIPVKTVRWFGETRPDQLTFGRAFVESFARAADENEILRLVLFVPMGFDDVKAMYFRPDRMVGGARLSVDRNLRAWLEGLAAPFGCGVEMRFSRSSVDAPLPTGGAGISPMQDEVELLADDPASLALRLAPTEYAKRELSQEKSEYLAAMSGGRVEQFDEGRFDEILRGFLELRGAKPKKSATKKKLKALQAAMGTDVPQSFRRLYETLDGGHSLFFGHDLLTLDGAIEERNSWAWIFDDWSLKDLQEFKSADTGVLPLYCCPRWLPFIDLGGGHYVGVDAAPAADGTCGQIIVAGRDIHHNRLVATSMHEFLEKCATYDETPGHELWSIFGELVL